FGGSIRPVRKGLRGGRHRLVHLGRAAGGEAGDDVARVGRVAAFERIVGAGPFAADVMAEGTGTHGGQILSMRPRAARFRTKAAMPISHGGASREVVTVLARVPIRRELMVTRSPSLRVTP